MRKIHGIRTEDTDKVKTILLKDLQRHSRIKVPIKSRPCSGVTYYVVDLDRTDFFDNSKPKRVVFGISSGPEDMEEEFEICDVLKGETEEEAIKRAKSFYYEELEVIIKTIPRKE